MKAFSYVFIGRKRPRQIIDRLQIKEESKEQKREKTNTVSFLCKFFFGGSWEGRLMHCADHAPHQFSSLGKLNAENNSQPLPLLAAFERPNNPKKNQVLVISRHIPNVQNPPHQTTDITMLTKRSQLSHVDAQTALIRMLM